MLANARDARAVPGRKTDVNDAQWIQRLHTCDLLRASFHPDREIAALRSYLRLRERHLDYAAAHIQHMQKALIKQLFGSELSTSPVQWLSDNGSAYTAEQTQAFARQIGLQPLTTPVCSPPSDSMAESFVKTMKRDYIHQMPKPDRATALRNLAIAFEHYNEEHPQSALDYRSPREFRSVAEIST